MRFLGNKQSILNEIVNLLDRKGLLSYRYTFFDAFCGTGAVSNGVKNFFDIKINDNLIFATTFSKGRIISQLCTFKELGFNPIDFFNSNKQTNVGFFSLNYAPKLSGRMYFNDFNAGRIDYFRLQIEEWKVTLRINENEYNYLLGCLLESVSKVANIAGVYGAYLKKRDPRAVKNIIFLPIETSESENSPAIVETYNNNLIDIIKDVDCDILYLDPPYTKNKYSTQYHVLETLIRNDNPDIRGITGGRDLKNVSDNWSKKYYVEVEFEQIIRETKAQHILLSYSSDGLMSKDFITNILKRYGYTNTFELVEISYKKYQNFKTTNKDGHFEYLFYIKKKPIQEIVYYCPLNYMGGKTNTIEYIKPELKGKKILIDLMGGGFNVGINGLNFISYIYNDTNFIVKELIEMFKNIDTVKILKKIESTIKKYGLTKHGQENYIKYRTEYNNNLKKTNDGNIYLFILILYGFQQQIRFNSSYEFNNPVGESGYNDSIKEKIVSFSSKLQKMNVVFVSKDFEKLTSIVNFDTLVYIDPPYLITLGSYNDGKRGFNGWNDTEEIRLINFINLIKNSGCKIVISNILNYKEKCNNYLINWIKENKPKVFNVTTRGREEVLITYETSVQNQ